MKLKMPVKIKLFSDSIVTLLIMFSFICIAVLFSTQVFESYLESEAMSICSDFEKRYFKNALDANENIISSEIVFAFPSGGIWVKNSDNHISLARYTSIKNQKDSTVFITNRLSKNLSNRHVFIDNKVCESALHRDFINLSLCNVHDSSGSNSYGCVCRCVHDDICSSQLN